MRTVIGAMTMAAWLTGCVIEDPDGVEPSQPEPPGDGLLEVSWLVGSSGCELAGVTDVRLEIGTLEESFACDTGAATIQLQAGDYSLVATGLDADGAARFEAREDVVSVFEDETSVLPTLRLSALPANLTLFWRFENGSLCGANGVADINVALYTVNQQIVDEFPDIVACDPGEASFTGIPAGEYTVSLLGLDDEARAIFEANEDIELLRGETLPEELVLVPLANEAP